MFVNRFTHRKRISRIVPALLVISLSFPVVHHSIITALRQPLGLIFVCGKIIGLCADAGVGILSRVELGVLWLLAPRVRQRLTMMPVELNTPSLIRVTIRVVFVIVTFILI